MVRVSWSFVPAGVLALAVACSSGTGAAAGGAAYGSPARPEPAAAKPDASADGSTPARAILVPRDSEDDGIAWEYAWIREHFGAYKRKGQSLLVNEDGHRLDRVTVSLSDGTEKTLYFDISRFFGRY